MRLPKWKWLAAICATAIIAGCGGSDGDDNKPTTEAPPPEDGEVIGTGEFNANTYLVTKSDAAGSSLTDDTFTVVKPQATVYKIGDVLIIDAHGGRLVRVVGVREAGTEIHYQYEQASLVEAFKSLDIHMQGTLTAEDLGDLSDLQTDPEITLGWAPSPKKSEGTGIVQDKLSYNQMQLEYKKLGGQVKDGITIDGYTRFSLNPDFFIRIKNGELEFAAKVSPNLDTSVTIGKQVGGRVFYKLDKSFKFKTIKSQIRVGWLYVPFTVTPVVNVSASASGTANSGFSTTQNYGVRGKFGFSRLPGSGFDAVANISPRASMSVSDVESELGVTLTFPKVELLFKFYNVFGPFFDAAPEASLSGKETVRGSEDGVEVEGRAAIVANAGLKPGKILNFQYSLFSTQLFSHELFSKTWFFPYPPEPDEPPAPDEPDEPPAPGEPDEPDPGSVTSP